MPENGRPIIDDATREARDRTVGWTVFGLAAIIGTFAALYYARLDLTLSHYDARAHLVVARRITDSLTPGWIQIGAVWLPLPHLANLVPVMWDWSYRTGFSGVALSVLTLAGGLAALGRYLHRRTGAPDVAIALPLLVLLNPNLLYLQSTPMTEPLLIGLVFAALLALDTWLDRPGRGAAHRAGLLLAAVILTRYEGWFVAAALVGLAAIARRRIPVAPALYAAGAVGAFLVLSRLTIGQWFVTSGFFVADNPALGRPFAALGQIWHGVRQLGGGPLALAGVAGAVLALRDLRSRPRLALPLALVAAAALPFLAFEAGHPFRIRYMVPLVAASGALAGCALGLLRGRVRHVGVAALALLSLAGLPPFDGSAPMVREAQIEHPWRAGRRTITAYLARHHDGRPILASMGSLAHYMQETSAIGLDLRDFIHEGNGRYWADAVRAPAAHVSWVLVEERAEGGDQLAARARADAGYLEGFVRVAEGGGAALYRRADGG